MSAPPKTVLSATPDEAAAIRAAVRGADPAEIAPGRSFATEADAPFLLAMIEDPRVSDPVYDIPRPFSEEGVTTWIRDFAQRQAAGEGMLVLASDFGGSQVLAYWQITIWPELASAELAGAVCSEMQSLGSGGAGAMRTFNWMFETLGVRLICLTAGLDNIRSAKLIDHAGFSRMGGRDVILSDGTTRPSLYWEMTRDAWRAMPHEDL